MRVPILFAAYLPNEKAAILHRTRPPGNKKSAKTLGDTEKVRTFATQYHYCIAPKPPTDSD